MIEGLKLIEALLLPSRGHKIFQICYVFLVQRERDSPSRIQIFSRMSLFYFFRFLQPALKVFMVHKALLTLLAVLPSLVAAQVVFPLKVSSDKRYLVDSNDRPFPILGRTAW